MSTPLSKMNWVALRTCLVRIAICCVIFVSISAVIVATSCSPQGVVGQTVQVEINTAIQPTQSELAGLDHGPPRPVGVMMGPDGNKLEFVANEIIFHPSSDQELQEFIDRYGATVLRDGTPLVHPDVEPRGPVTSSGWYLLRIDTSKSTLDDAGQNLTNAGLTGLFEFSSEDSARTMALFVRESARGVGINPLVYGDASIEHPMSMTTNVDAETFTWFTEDDDPNTPGDQGLSTGVIRAWDWLSYKGILEVPGVYYVPKIAIIDGGFDLDEVTGVPANGNLDYGTLEKPIQYDLVDRDFLAGGVNLSKCSGGSDCPWHGQGAFGIAAARPKNAYGSAGVGGHFVRPMLIRVGNDMYHVAWAIRSAVIGGADVVSISSSGGCLTYHTLCSLPPNDIYEMFLMSVRFARSYLTSVVASAGNDGVDVDGEEYYPCLTEGVICVGSVDQNKMNVFNFGDGVDIWAPTNMLSTTTPDTLANDPDNFGIDELYNFGGTSASAPFVAGVVGLMKSANSNLSYEQVLSTLQTTANPSPDPLVQRGYVDAYRAVRGLLTNLPPTVDITLPGDGQTFGWKNTPLLQVTYNDPEVTQDNIYRWNGEVVYSLELDGELCRSNSPPYTCSSTLSEMSLGSQLLTATATDKFGETVIDQIRINIVNRPPEPEIVRPLATATLYSHLPTRMTAFVPDPDETIPDSAVSWTSSKDGALGTGWQITRDLSSGEHTLTVVAVDGKGLTGQDQVIVNVTPGGSLPLPVITGPDDNTFISPGTTITLTGSATDPEDGTLGKKKLEWRSSIDGVLGTGNSIQVTLSGPAVPCNPESVAHTITLTATDSDGNKVSVEITIYVGIIC